MNIMQMREEHKEELAKADALIGPLGHQMTASEEEQYKGTMRRVEALRGQIEARKAQSTIFSHVQQRCMPSWVAGGDAPASGAASGFMATYTPALNAADTQSRDYSEALGSFLLSGGKLPPARPW